jgi:uncharacterized protein
MINNKNIPDLSENRTPWISFFTLILFVLGGLFVGQFIGILAILPFYNLDLQEAAQIFETTQREPKDRIPMMIMQASTMGFAFIFSPLIYLFSFEKKTLGIFFNKHSNNFIPLLLTAFITISFMFVNSILVEWNANLELPEFLRGFEEWAKSFEEQARRLTEFLTGFNSTFEFLIGIIVIAIIPAIGEELLFRGLIQNLLVKMVKNIHVAVIIAGFIFSAIHFQFYGLIPRMALGILFGYLYVWSGSLIIPVIAHFINNGLTLTLIYLHRFNYIAYDIEKEESVPGPNIAIFLIIGIFLLYYFRKYFKEKKNHI